MQKSKICLFASQPFEQEGGLSYRFQQFGNILEKNGFEVTFFSEDLFCSRTSTSQKAFLHRLQLIAKEHEVFILQPDVLYFYYPFLREKILIVDLICPFHLEHLQKIQSLPKGLVKSKMDEVPFLTRIFQFSLLAGDYFLCGHEVQKKYYQSLVPEDKRIAAMMQIIPYGIHPPIKLKHKKVLRNIIPGLDSSHFIFSWFGGLWDWYDPFPLLEGFALLAKRNPKVRLIFLSGKIQGYAEHSLSLKTIEKINNLGLLYRSVFFINQWIHRNEIPYYLKETDAVVTSFQETEETQVSCRIRYHDLLQNAVPMINSKGDDFSLLIQEKKWGVVVQEQTKEAWYQALKQMLDPAFLKSCRQNILSDQKIFSWDKVVQPLVSICQNPNKRKSRIKNKNDSLSKTSIQGKKIMIFGASKAGLRTMSLLQSHKAEVIGFVDNDPKKWGQFLEGKKIFSPNRLEKKNFDGIIIASFPGRQEITKQLKDLGFSESKDFFWFGDERL